LTAANLGARIGRADRRRLLDRLDELADLDREMRRPGTLAGPRHEAADRAAKEAPDDAEA
jgi:hypothetical protein